MSINLHSKLELDGSYKLIQLTPDLMETLKDDSLSSTMRFKSLDKAKADVVLCSEDKTWIIREKSHSNTVMLMHEFASEGNPVNNIVINGVPDPTSDFLGFSKTTFEYETRPANGQLNLDLVPIYNGEMNFTVDSTKLFTTKQELLDNSPCSIKEYRKNWAKVGGSVINGQICILSAEFLAKSLHVTLMSIMAESLDLDILSLDKVFDAVEKGFDEDFNPYTKEVIKTVIRKFGISNESNDNDKSTYKLNMLPIAKWYGIRALKKYVSKTSMSQDEFLTNWKSLFPPFFPCDIDINMLRGWFYKPTGSNIQYISKETMPMDIKDRFKMLFKLQSQWELEDIRPFIEELNVKGLKIDNFIMKYARRKKIGNSKIIVTSR
ncbi:hypothetical protein Kpol_1048p66 [Vanderwaltozyma polyspora DSM 70294]|uniref:Sister chromatid cohesion protein DCC1 n=1 Tax=Vanderwaltozyma polyspora (strain ATCC 22028 / DSM 70294 / BCRC 21397 / CBS 2163 / NBRC 10782 / NRRL Y-8283 / UCD 57-17) TaxID=436907 RepID=A7TGM8_VANPO|nr:uncharacterized protein Kpol_1048p66 [Vanderwaltozyma polyspora DSM 70294]EDO18635.1 hypothetical protein Kpol_1048p66 [Vanderwaltozyma polyspora DSM 70294]